jgi:hypothetical protein
MKPRIFAAALASLLVSCAALADTAYQPFVLASVNDTGLEEQVEATVDALKAGGFTIAGQYSPVDGSVVIVATNETLKKAAAATDSGGYSAGQRVSVTERDGKTEVAFINPLYIQYAYRVDTDLQPVLDNLGKALGNQESFGAEKEMTAKKLGNYKYMMGMPKFDDHLELGSFNSFEEALAAVEAGLAREGDALSQVYRIDIPGKDQAVFGVGMRATGGSEDEQDIDSAFQMSIVDFEGPAKVAYFPYEVLVNGKEVEALHMRFRMAVHFPDLSMMGAHGFTKLMSSPGATEDALEGMLKPR